MYQNKYKYKQYGWKYQTALGRCFITQRPIDVEPWIEEVTCTLFVPDGSVDAYQANAQWSDVFPDIRPISTAGVGQAMSDAHSSAMPSAYYSPDGKRISEPQRGLNIVRMADGTTKKVVVK